jgi:hypothetical protein
VKAKMAKRKERTNESPQNPRVAPSPLGTPVTQGLVPQSGGSQEIDHEIGKIDQEIPNLLD